MAQESDGKIEALALAVATGTSVRSWCRSNGVAERTGYGWASRAKFKRRVTTLRNRAIDEAIGILAHSAASASATMLVICSNPEEPSPVRLSAARAILSSYAELRDHKAWAERFEAMEAKLAELAKR